MHAEKMLKLQKRAARVITSSGLEERSSKIFQMLKWTKIQSILKKRELVMTFKPLRCMAPELYLTQMFHKTIFFKEASPKEEQFHEKN